MPTHSHTHCQVAQTNRTSQNLAISMSLPTLKKKLTKFEIMKGMIKHESTTMHIRHWAIGGYINIYEHKQTA